MNLLFLIPTILSVIVAGCLAYKGKDHWGWFVFLAIVLMPSYKVIHNPTDDVTKECIKAMKEIGGE